MEMINWRQRKYLWNHISDLLSGISILYRFLVGWLKKRYRDRMALNPLSTQVFAASYVPLIHSTLDKMDAISQAKF